MRNVMDTVLAMAVTAALLAAIVTGAVVLAISG
jgi:hypothetical protein